MGSIGVIFLIGYGIYNLCKQKKVYTYRIDGDTEITYLKYLAKGLVLNGFNPFIIIFWLGLVGVVAVNYEYDQSEQRYFFVGVLITIFISDVLKAFLANRLRTFVTPKRILIMNRAVAVILVLFGVNLIYYIYDKFGSV
jgi:threonine/homoserine/homoserine lactone efflux protein